MEVHTLSHGPVTASTKSSPSMDSGHGTFFSKSDVQYLPLSGENDIELDGFLRACRGIVDVVGFLGKAFSPVKEDIRGNISKVDAVYQQDTQRYATVKKLLDAEIVDWPNRMGPATEALLWLKRALEFICVFLDLLVVDHRCGKKSEGLAVIASEAYGRTLKKHHGKVERCLFHVIIRAIPYRKDFLKRIADSRANTDECIADISRYLEHHMKENVDRVVSMYKELGFEK